MQETLSEFVARKRHEKGMSRNRLASAAGLGIGTVQAIEDGRRRYVRRDQVEALARGLGVPPEALWARIPEAGRDRNWIPLLRPIGADR